MRLRFGLCVARTLATYMPAEMRHESAYPSDPHHRLLVRLVALLLHRRLNVALVDGKGVRWMVALASPGEFQEQPRRIPALVGRLRGRFEIALPEQDAHQRRGGGRATTERRVPVGQFGLFCLKRCAAAASPEFGRTEGIFAPNQVAGSRSEGRADPSVP
jgi:hypothetical protein